MQKAKETTISVTKCVTLLCIFATTAQAVSVSERSKLNNVHVNQDGLCMSPECIHTASSVLNNMDLTIDPCEDFYQFSCGNFIQTRIIPADKVVVNTFTLIEDKLQDQVKSLIEETPRDGKPKYLQLPHKMYRACMNTTLIEKLGSSPIVEIGQILGGWPVIKGESWNADNSWTWQDAIKMYHKIGLTTDHIFEFGVITDLVNTTKRIIDVDQTLFGLSREYLVMGLNDSHVAAYFKYLTGVAILLGAKEEDALKEIKEALQFEMDLAAISLSMEERRNFTLSYNLRTVTKLQTTYPYINWKDYINALLPESLQIDDDEVVNVSGLVFFEELGPLLAKTPSRTIANYMMYRVHSSLVQFLSEEFRKLFLQYVTALSGKTENQPRWKQCVDATTSSLGIAIGSLYVRKYFDEDSKKTALEMVNHIRDTLANTIRQVDWMDAKTRKSALEKLDAMATHIGYPDELIDTDKVDKFYEKLDIDPSKYLESFLKIIVFDTDKAYNKLRLPVNKTDWVQHAKPARVGAYYSVQENSIQFPAGILQEKLFHANRPKYMNYGAIGSVIAHEITHGFDDQGSQFDLKGNLIDWWQRDTKQAYLTKARCIIEQYGNFTEKLTRLKLNGVNTQGENIADNGGVKASYLAYKAWSNTNGPEPKLPGLDFSPEQMFWIAAAQNWCDKATQKYIELSITVGVHSPSEFRVLGPFVNIKDFSKDFQCPVGSRMNPVHKCEVW